MKECLVLGCTFSFTDPFSYSHRGFSPVSESALKVVNSFNGFRRCSKPIL